MANNLELNAGSGGATIASDDVGGVHYPVGKTAYGGEDSATLVSLTNGLPVQPATSAAFPVTDNGSTLSVDDGGGSLTVDGTVAVTGTFWQATQPVSLASVPSHDVTNAGTFAVQAAQSGTWNVGTVTAVTGITNAVAVTDNSGSLTVDAPVGTPVFVRLSDGASAISTLPVSLASVPSHAVTNAGTFAVQEGGAALTALQLIDNLVLAEDAAHASGDPGVQALAVRNDSDASLAGTTGDYTPLQVDANGYLKVNIKAGAGSGGTASTDDAAFTAASGSGTPMMGFVTADGVDSGDVGVVGMLANRQLKVTLFDSAGVELAVGGGTQYTEDAAAAANPVGNALIVVRDDARAGSLTSTDGDNVALRGNNKGELYVKHTDALDVNAHAVTDGGGSLTVDGTVAVSGTVAVTDNAGSLTVDNAGTFAVQAAQSGTWTVQPGNTANTTAWLVTGTGGTFPVTDSGGSLTVDNGGTFAVQVTSLPASTNTIEVVGDAAHDAAAAGNPLLCGAYASAAAPTDVSADADAVRLWALRSGALAVQPTYAGVLGVAGNGASGTGVQRVTIANDSTGVLATVSTVTTVSTLTGGGVAHDGADSGNPHKVGAKASTSLSGLTLVANADRTDLYAGVDGVQITRPHCNLEDISTGNASNTDGTSTQCIAAAGVGVKTYLTTVILTNTSSSNIYVEIKDGTTAKLTVPVPANGGAVVNLPVPLPGTANTAWNFDPSAATTTVYCSMVGFKSKV